MSSDFRISLQLLWGRRERGERGPKPGLTVEQIVAAAIELADAEGLEAASMRRVAERLGVGAMSLYRYVPGKTELLDLMLDADPRRGSGRSADGRLARRGSRGCARRSRARIRRHPWMLQVVIGQRPPLGPNIIADFDAYLAAVSGIGLTPAEMIADDRARRATTSRARPAPTSRPQTERESGVSDEQWWGERQEFWEDYFDPERFPAISAVWEAGRLRGGRSTPSSSASSGSWTGSKRCSPAADRGTPRAGARTRSARRRAASPASRARAATRRSPARPARSPRRSRAPRTRTSATGRPPRWRSRGPTTAAPSV